MCVEETKFVHLSGNDIISIIYGDLQFFPTSLISNQPINGLDRQVKLEIGDKGLLKKKVGSFLGVI